jgi:hypothetical protein
VNKIKFINELEAGNSTNFELALEKAAKYIDTQLKTTILMTTDGQENTGLEMRALPALTTLIVQCKFEVTFHLLAFTRQSDIKLLVDLAKIGNTTGTVQYIKDAYDVSSSVTNLAEIIQCQSSVLTCDEVKVENNVIMSNISAKSKICLNGIPIAMELKEVELASLASDVFTDIVVGLVQRASRQAVTCDVQLTLSRCNQLRKIFQCGPEQWIHSTQYAEIQNHIIHMLKVISEPHNPDTTAQLAALGYGLVFKKRRLERRNYETVLNNHEFVQQLLCHKLTF